MTGRYVVTKYCQSQLQQDEAAWAAQTTWRLLSTAADDLVKFIKEGEVTPRPEIKSDLALLKARAPQWLSDNEARDLWFE